MLVLVVNAGSSSLKSQLIETEGKVCRMKCLAEKVGTDEAYMNVSFAPDFQKVTYNASGLSVSQCLAKLLDVMADDPESPISGLGQIDAIGNRIVAGGEYFTKAALIDDEARENLASRVRELEDIKEEIQSAQFLETQALDMGGATGIGHTDSSVIPGTNPSE